MQTETNEKLKKTSSKKTTTQACVPLSTIFSRIFVNVNNISSRKVGETMSNSVDVNGSPQFTKSTFHGMNLIISCSMSNSTEITYL